MLIEKRKGNKDWALWYATSELAIEEEKVIHSDQKYVLERYERLATCSGFTLPLTHLFLG